jgi:hypothetical protein
MKLYTKISLLATGCFVAWGIALEILDPPPVPSAPAGVTPTTFADLGCFDLSGGFSGRRPGEVLKRLPRSILGLDARKVLIQGFMIPTGLSGGRQVQAFLLARSQANCCFGMPLGLYDVVEVRMSGRPTGVMMDRVLTVVGCLHVRERWQGDVLGSIYQLDAETVEPAGP